MLDDDRASALVTNFASQWLYLRNVPAVYPDEDLFPHVGEALRQAMRRETELFVESIFRGDQNVLELLTADYTFVNERLARHYDIPHVYGSHFRRVSLDRLPNDARRGLLGHASILAVTAYPNRTSPVLRGKWVLENLLGTPPASPPPDVPSLEETTDDGEVLSMREATERHRANPTCASCHRLMDPPGFALEQFDAVGRFRTHTSGEYADRCDGRVAGWHAIRRCIWFAGRVGFESWAFCRYTDGEAHDLCPRQRAGALRRSDRAGHSARCGRRKLSFLIDYSWHRQESTVQNEENGVMIISKNTLARRTVLRGVGAALALPMLDAMVPALSGISGRAAEPVRRLGVGPTVQTVWRWMRGCPPQRSRLSCQRH